MSIQWNQQLVRYVISKVIKFLEQIVRNKPITKDHRTRNNWTECKPTDREGRPGVDFPAVRNCPKKIKNLNLIKLASKRNGANRKWHTRLFGFDFLNLKLMPIDSEWNSTSDNQTCFYTKSMGVVPRKAAKLEKIGWNLKKPNWNQTFFTGTFPGISRLQ